ncbi:ferritin-like metal-binding protein YciE [Variovorax ginsengisoli]|uniref:Ferritin-like metal-binding protein YciE n=1 Tax=Variovorax ginsengisoli TaxID=363844 RepID=A0ABT9SF13_9BURK|nr:ferritin-like metal-binding protein YciE [Variovorax ginsengisoli]
MIRRRIHRFEHAAQGHLGDRLGRKSLIVAPIGSAQKAELNEIASYTSLCLMAKKLGF